MTIQIVIPISDSTQTVTASSGLLDATSNGGWSTWTVDGGGGSSSSNSSTEEDVLLVGTDSMVAGRRREYFQTVLIICSLFRSDFYFLLVPMSKMEIVCVHLFLCIVDIRPVVAPLLRSSLVGFPTTDLIHVSKIARNNCMCITYRS